MNCQERIGFLFAHACDRPAVAKCGKCGKVVCEAHLLQEGEERACASCGSAYPHGTAIRRQAEPFVYAGSVFEGYSVYDAEDFRAFDAPPPGTDAEFEADESAS